LLAIWFGDLVALADLDNGTLGAFTGRSRG